MIYMRLTILILLAALSGISMAWHNEATPAMLDARYEYVSCDVDYAKSWLSMREGCGEEENVTVFDSSGYIDEIESDLAELAEARDDGDVVDFGVTMLSYGADALQLLGAIAGDALDHKTLPFFSCVRDGEKPLMEDRNGCRAAAMEKERDASKEYMGNELDYANEQTGDMGALGADTSGMREVVSYGDELMDDIDPAFDTGKPDEVLKLHLRHSRLVMLFRLEKMVATIDYARPLIQDSGNANRDEILRRGDALEYAVKETMGECEYSAEVESRAEYGEQNLECWDQSLEHYEEFNELGALILEGVGG